MLQVWSNNTYTTALHRVKAMDQVDPFSMPFFFNPSYETVVQPLEWAGGALAYQPIHWGEFPRKQADGDCADSGEEVQVSNYRV